MTVPAYGSAMSFLHCFHVYSHFPSVFWRDSRLCVERPSYVEVGCGSTTASGRKWGCTSGITLLLSSEVDLWKG